MYKSYLAFQIASGKDTKFDLFTEWPNDFDIETLPQIPKQELKPQPKVHKSESVSAALNKFDIRETVMQQQTELFLQPQNKSESSATTPRRRQSEDKILQMVDDREDDARSESIASLSQHGVSIETIQRIEKKN